MSVKLLELVWHPEQGLWNWELLSRLKSFLSLRWYSRVERCIVSVDSFLLYMRAIIRRASALGPWAVISALRAEAVGLEGFSVLYLDLGTHAGGTELRRMVKNLRARAPSRLRAFGFEATEDVAAAAREKLADLPEVTVVHAAVCRQASGNVCLHVGDGGIGNSLYRRLRRTVEVPGVQLSSWIRENGLDSDREICLLRMNIEGAEVDVIEDLIESGLCHKIDGFFGMWDDVGKIDPRRGQRFRSLLRQQRIWPFTFNMRDHRSPLRLKAIELEIDTCLRRALRRRAADATQGSTTLKTTQFPSMKRRAA
jgi:FkbM family methyltransferase